MFYNALWVLHTRMQSGGGRPKKYKEFMMSAENIFNDKENEGFENVLIRRGCDIPESTQVVNFDKVERICDVSWKTKTSQKSTNNYIL